MFKYTVSQEMNILITNILLVYSTMHYTIEDL